MDGSLRFGALVKYLASTYCRACFRGAFSHEKNLRMCWSGTSCTLCGRGAVYDPTTNSAETSSDPEMQNMHIVRVLLFEWSIAGCRSCGRQANPSLRKNAYGTFPNELFFDVWFGPYCCVCGLGGVSPSHTQRVIDIQQKHHPKPITTTFHTNRKRFEH